jgi:hypothetical protein
LSDSIRNTISTNGTGCISKFISRLLFILSHSTSSLVYVTFESADLIGECLFLLGNGLFLFLAWRASLTAASDFVYPFCNLFLFLQHFFGLLAKTLNALLVSGLAGLI